MGLFAPPETGVLLVVLLIMVIGGLVHGTLGLGFPLVTTPLLSLLFDVRMAIILTLLPTIAVNLLMILRGGDWHLSLGRYWPLAAWAVVGSLIGTQLLISIDPEPFRLLLAAMILVYLNVERLGRFRLAWVRQHPPRAMFLFGITAGMLAGTVNVMVPILVIFALESGLAATAMIQVFNLCFLGGKLAQLSSLSGQGWIDAALLPVALLLAVAAVMALMLGMRLGRRIDQQTYRRWLRGGLWLAVPLLLVQFLYNLAQSG